MNPTHIISGTPGAFAKSLNALVAARDVALSIVSVSAGSGRLVAIVEETGNKNTRGALIEVAVIRQDPAEELAALATENPCWSAVAAFDFPASAKKSASATETAPEADAEPEAKPVAVKSILVLAALRQP